MNRTSSAVSAKLHHSALYLHPARSRQWQET